MTAPVDVAAAVLAAVTPPTPKWCGYDAALLWELLLNDSDEERHTRLTGLIGAAAEMGGAQEEASRLADQVEALRIELDEARARAAAVEAALNYDRETTGYDFGTVEKSRIRAALTGVTVGVEKATPHTRAELLNLLSAERKETDRLRRVVYAMEELLAEKLA